MSPNKKGNWLGSLARTLIRDWRVKGTIQKLFGVIPGGSSLHYLMQRRVGGMAAFQRECDTKVDDWRLMMGHFRAARVDLPNATLLEMGTGWYPTFPVCLYLAGVGRVLTVDVTRLMRAETVLLMVERLADHLPLIAKTAGVELADVETRYAALAGALRGGATIEAATGGKIEYHAPADASKTTFGDATIDVVFSNSVLEHVPPAIIEACFAESMRILKPGGIIFHSVNCGDHYAYTDPKVNQLHYLQFSKRQWQWWDNKFLYQNRLRAIDFTTMARSAGFAIEIDTSRPAPQRLAQLEAIEVHPEFSHYPREQLAITSIDFVGRK